MTGFIDDQDTLETHAFLQWKGTDACFDFKCSCGLDSHCDGFFANFVQCPACGVEWEMPCILYPRLSRRKAGGPEPIIPISSTPPDWWKEQNV